MKTRILPGWLVTIVVAVAVAAWVCAQDAPRALPRASEAAAPRPNSNVIVQASPAAPTAQNTQAEQAPLPSTDLSAWSREIQKLTQASVEEHVIATYITNCAGLFSLTADQIIYLKNVGVSPRIINVMLQHDQQLFPATGLVNAPAAPPAGWTAASPEPAELPMLANEEAQDPWLLNEGYYAPEQPDNLGPVRAPYAVKLTDPIIMLRLPTFTVPCW
jgi:hypothetical protein